VNTKFAQTDVLIVGGGPAGLAAAIALRDRGASVTVADAMKTPIDKACGEGLMPDSLHELEKLGVSLSPRDGAAFHGIRFKSEGTIATARFPSGTGIGVRRQILHARLIARAEEAGVKLRWESPVQLRARGRVEIAGEAQVFGQLIGADGQASQVRRWAGLERGSAAVKRFGFRRHFQVKLWSPFVEVYWGKSGQAYVTPTGPNEVCVAIVTRDPQCRLAEILDELPELRAKLGGARFCYMDAERGALTTTRRFDRIVRGRVALVGDASGSADAITGEGIGMAFRQALLLADCLENGNLGRYNRLHGETLDLPQTMARILLSMDRWSGLRRRVVTMLARNPALFNRMLGMHLGIESPLHFVSTKGLEVAWRLAIALSDEPSLQTRQAIQEN